MRNVVFHFILIPLFTLLVTACSPQFDWRDIHRNNLPYRALMPGKPVEISHEIQLGQQTVPMHMAITKIDNVSFAIGAAKMPDAIKAQEAIPLIKNALIDNITGTITHEKTTNTTTRGKLTLITEFDAISTTRSTAGAPIRMIGRLVARDTWVFQVLVSGPAREINQVAVDTFLTAFTPD